MEIFMGFVYAEIELVNLEDVMCARRHIIGEEEIKRTRVTMLVDSGAYMLTINENIQAYLQLPFIEKKRSQTADGRITTYDVVGPVQVRFAGKLSTCSALVLPGDNEPLLGAIPMEEMDVVIHPQRQELVVNPDHPNGHIWSSWSGWKLSWNLTNDAKYMRWASE
jgi:clan AA aspartic protease